MAEPENPAPAEPDVAPTEPDDEEGEFVVEDLETDEDPKGGKPPGTSGCYVPG